MESNPVRMRIDPRNFPYVYRDRLERPHERDPLIRNHQGPPINRFELVAALGSRSISA
jgi:hypothetical protein